MVEKTIQQFKDNLEIEEVGQSIELPKPDNMNNGIEVIPEEDGGVTLDFDPSQQKTDETDFNSNISEFLDDSLLTKISTDLQDNYEDDKSSRADWEDSYKNGLDLLGFKYEERAKTFCRSIRCYSSIIIRSCNTISSTSL